MNLNLAIDGEIDPAALFGHADRNLKILRELLDVHLAARNEMPRKRRAKVADLCKQGDAAIAKRDYDLVGLLRQGDRPGPP